MIIWNSIAATTESEYSYIAHFPSEGALFLESSSARRPSYMFQIEFVKCKCSRFVHFNKQHAKDTVQYNKKQQKSSNGAVQMVETVII